MNQKSGASMVAPVDPVTGQFLRFLDHHSAVHLCVFFRSCRVTDPEDGFLCTAQK